MAISFIACLNGAPVLIKTKIMNINIKHPLEALTIEEINNAVEFFKADKNTDKNSAYSHITLIEPDKDFIKSYKDGDEFSRLVKIVGVDSQSKGFEADINLSEKKIISLKALSSDAQPTYHTSEVFSAIMLVLENKDYQEALKKRGITNLDLVHIDPWPGGGIIHKDLKEGHRALKAISFLKENPTDNAYAKPVQGLIAHIDLTDMKVLEIEDHGVIDMPKANARYDADGQEKLRDEPKEISITQPQGPGYKVNSNKISWEGWDVRVSIDPIGGIILQNLCFDERPILFRAGMSDMVVPYGTSDPMHSWKAVFDGTEYGFGALANSLTLGCDCLGEIHYFDSHQLSFDGSVNTIENAICLHEEDYGIQWKHTNTIGEGSSEVRRSRRLVISSFSTVGNYDYGIFWYLYLDGTIQLEMKLTGIVGVSAFDASIHKTSQDMRITQELVSPIHQHLFNVRLDWFLDGGNNQLLETEVEPMPMDSSNPYGTQFQAISRHLSTENDAKRNTSAEKSRVWKILNPEKKNSIGSSSAYKILPGNTPVLLSNSDSVVGQRASFAKHNLWATPFHKEEIYGAGMHTVMHSGQGGLDDITSKNRDISNCDLVTWYTFGVTHVPRPEDWPVMPVEYCGFHLIPVGFFDQNPTINLPPSCKTNKD